MIVYARHEISDKARDLQGIASRQICDKELKK